MMKTDTGLAFAAAHAKIYVYFNIRAFFFYFLHTHLLKHSTFELSILNYISIKYYFFLIFLIVCVFFTHNNCVFLYKFALFDVG